MGELIDNMFEEKYKKLLKDTMLLGELTENRTNVKTFTLFDQKIDFHCSLNEGKLPLITGKKIFYDKALAEFKWIWSGRSNIDFLHKYGVTWWDEYANDLGTVEKSYGHQVRYFNGYFDQINDVVEKIKNKSRRAYITFWNPTNQNEQIPCCYTGMNFVRINDTLNMKMNFRSSDLFLGLPYDFIIGWHFLKNICYQTRLNMGTISYGLENAHIYINHVNGVYDYLSKPHYNLPSYNGKKELDDYKHGPLINAKMNN